MQSEIDMIIYASGFKSESCSAPEPVFSSCHHLLGSTTKRMMVFLLALMSLLGNLGTLLLRHRFGKRRRKTTSDVTELFMSHLSVCNCMIGVYLAILSVADQLQGVDYLWTERAMRSSSWCVVSCVLFLLSSEVSVFIVTIATLE